MKLKSGVLLAVLWLSGCAHHAHDRRLPQAINNDEKIEELAADKLARAGIVAPQARIHISAHNGLTLLSGEVASPVQQQQAIQTVRAVPGVRLLHNALVIGKVSSEKSQAADEQISEQLQAVLEKSQQLPPFAAEQLRIVTEQGVVFLLGVVTQAEGAQITEIAQRIRGVKKVVQLFEYQDE